MMPSEVFKRQANLPTNFPLYRMNRKNQQTNTQPTNTRPRDEVITGLIFLMQCTQREILESELWVLQQLSCLPEKPYTIGNLRLLLSKNTIVYAKLDRIRDAVKNLTKKEWLIHDAVKGEYYLDPVIAKAVRLHRPIKANDVGALMEFIHERLITASESGKRPLQSAWTDYGRKAIQSIGENEFEQQVHFRIRFAVTLYSSGEVIEAFRLLEHAYELATLHLDALHVLRAQTISNLAYLCLELGDLPRTKTLIETLDAMYIAVEGEDTESTLIMHTDLAVLQSQNGEFAKATSSAEQAVQKLEQQLGSGHQSLLRSYNNLAQVYKNAGEYDSANTVLEKIISIADNIPGRPSAENAGYRINQAMLFREQGKYDAAKSCLQSVLEETTQHLGAEHPLTNSCYASLALVLREMGDYSESLASLEKVVVNAEKQVGPQDPRSISERIRRTTLLVDMGKFREAREIVEREMHNALTCEDKRYTFYVPCLNDVVGACQMVSDWNNARITLEHAISILERDLGTNHPETASHYSELAWVLESQGFHKPARRYFESSCRIIQKHYGSRHQRTAEELAKLARVESKLGNESKAKSYMKHVCRIHRNVFGVDHPITLSSEFQLAWICQRLGQYTEAKTLLEQLIPKKELVSGAEDLDTAIAKVNLALVLRAMGHYGSAIALIESACTILGNQLPAGHPTLQSAESSRTEIRSVLS